MESFLRKRWFWLRLLIAFLVVPPFCSSCYFAFVALISTEHYGWRDVLLLQLAGILYSVPGYLMFSLFGIPLIVLLVAKGATGFRAFILGGVLCTSLWWLNPYFESPSTPGWKAAYLGRVTNFVPVFSGFGLINGLLTRIILFGLKTPRAD